MARGETVGVMRRGEGMQHYPGRSMFWIVMMFVQSKVSAWHFARGCAVLSVELREIETNSNYLFYRLIQRPFKYLAWRG